MAQLIDTSVFIAEERRGIPVPDLLDRLADPIVALAAVTASELLVGVLLASPQYRRDAREAYVERILASIPAIPFDLDIARVHARLAAEMMRSGVQIGAHDLQIAATAVALGYQVLTANVRDFRRVPNLEVQSFADLS
jgi:tRNA(fMet)-specific endonuclease VapC